MLQAMLKQYKKYKRNFHHAQSDEGSSKELKKQPHSHDSKILHYLFSKLDKKMNKSLALLKEIKQDVCKVVQDLRQMEVNIVAKCFIGLLNKLLILHHKLPAK